MTKTKECREEKDVCPFLLENSRPLPLLQEPRIPFFSSGTLDFLSNCLRIDFSFPPFLLGELYCQGKGAIIFIPQLLPIVEWRGS